MSDKNKVSLEAHFENIEEIIGEMENGEISLDRSFELYIKVPLSFSKTGIYSPGRCSSTR